MTPAHSIFRRIKGGQFSVVAIAIAMMGVLLFPVLQPVSAQDAAPPGGASTPTTQPINGMAIRASRDLSAAISREAQATRAQQIALDQIDQLRGQIAQTDAAIARQKAQVAALGNDATPQRMAATDQLVKLQQDGLDERSRLAFQLENAHTAYAVAMEARAGVADAQRRLWAAYGISTAPTTQPGQIMSGQAAEPAAQPANSYTFNEPPPASEQAMPYGGDVDSGYYDNGQGEPAYSGTQYVTPGVAPQGYAPANTYDNPYYYPNSSYYGPYYGSYYGGYPYYYPYYWPGFFGFVYVNHFHDHDRDHHWNGNWNGGQGHNGTAQASPRAAPAAARSAPASPMFSHFGGFGGGGHHR
jgi:hypothetical protein